MTLSDQAWSVLAQLREDDVWDAALCSAEGRDELVGAGLAQLGGGRTKLTASGAALAARLGDGAWFGTGTRN
jgi:hypothetical protein